MVDYRICVIWITVDHNNIFEQLKLQHKLVYIQRSRCDCLLIPTYILCIKHKPVGNPDTWAVLILWQSFLVWNSHYKEIFRLRSPPFIRYCNCLRRKIRQCLIYSLSVGNYNTSPSHICSYHGNSRVGRISNALRSPKVLSNAVTFVIYHRFLWHIYMPQRTFCSFFKITATPPPVHWIMATCFAEWHNSKITILRLDMTIKLMQHNRYQSWFHARFHVSVEHESKQRSWTLIRDDSHCPSMQQINLTLITKLSIVMTRYTVHVSIRWFFLYVVDQHNFG